MPARRLVENAHVASLLRNKQAPKRLYDSVISLNVLVEVSGAGLAMLQEEVWEITHQYLVNGPAALRLECLYTQNGSKP